jgi:hypothetical protein
VADRIGQLVRDAILNRQVQLADSLAGLGVGLCIAGQCGGHVNQTVRWRGFGAPVVGQGDFDTHDAIASRPFWVIQ